MTYRQNIIFIFTAKRKRRQFMTLTNIKIRSRRPANIYVDTLDDQYPRLNNQRCILYAQCNAIVSSIAPKPDANATRFTNTS